jgi:pyruvate,water dikinase
LEDYDFTVEIREDILRSRLEGFETDFMESRLKIIGYLMIHTRQLDMIMLNATAVNHYRSKFKADLAQILNQTPKL